MTEKSNHTEKPAIPRSRVIVDTSVFVNPETMVLLGDSVATAIEGFLEVCRKYSIEIFTPLSIFREISTFAPEETLKTLKTRAVVRAPDLYNTHVPAIMFHTFVRELRQRVNKGLHIAEKAIKSDDVPENVRWVRQHYREALRSGIVDSVEDLEVVLLAREVGGVILTADEGIANMADSFGIEVFTAREFLDYCKDTARE
ncbi:MAG: RNA ligase partner protein [Desulfobacterales bacterium]|nr:RNA ligase partner protein [Desulfobacterales bacterium]MBS3754219.1 RNA ligase partner protein [Desulfobacterales bacterium]